MCIHVKARLKWNDIPKSDHCIQSFQNNHTEKICNTYLVPSAASFDAQLDALVTMGHDSESTYQQYSKYTVFVKVC